MEKMRSFEGADIHITQKRRLRSSSSISEVSNLQEAPINLTWIVVFTVMICTASLLVDDLFFNHNLLNGQHFTIGASEHEYPRHFTPLSRHAISPAFGLDTTNFDIIEINGVNIDDDSSFQGFQVSKIQEGNWNGQFNDEDIEQLGDFKTMSKADLINAVIANRSTREKHAFVRGGAVFLLFVILAIWGLSAYISVIYLRSLKSRDKDLNAQLDCRELYTTNDLVNAHNLMTVTPTVLTFGQHSRTKQPTVEYMQLEEGHS